MSKSKFNVNLCGDFSDNEEEYEYIKPYEPENAAAEVKPKIKPIKKNKIKVKIYKNIDDLVSKIYKK